ncbi:hypothetical protein CXG81DRAFT_11624 [Caulochytrium protostelioides]|uniref:Rab-GAP TBC domain-containing protein n=1 Tax=Caulochytrium protostelioides TaxID=1555241 RepID=A0A4P9X8V9_9FUNG|nr:hypothetical protein CXG81DRAFT_11624 [Caulochytrium protostelioides]|eukprot:RKP01753.1 hypothetical protein CXG81DRAFT_11624 [Caulochytrium protostelioides]
MPPSRRRLKKLVHKGVPHAMRAAAWFRLAGAHDRLEEGRYAALAAEAADPATAAANPFFDIIERDLHRCFPNHVLFCTPGGEGQQALREVLRAYALFNPTVGYCQGLGMVAGTLLMLLERERAFWVLVCLLETPCKGLYDPDLLQLKTDAIVFDRLLAKKLPRLARHFCANDVSALMFITQWFLTIFTTSLPWPSALRVWDMLLVDGPKAIFRIGLAVLMIGKRHLIKACPTNAEILPWILHVPTEHLQPDAVVFVALGIELRASDIVKMRLSASKAQLAGLV